MGMGTGMGIMPKVLPVLSKDPIATVIIANVKKDIFIAVDMDIMDMVSTARCLKITEKVSFNIASEASYVYILNGQTENGQFWRVFENLKLAVKQCYQTGHF